MTILEQQMMLAVRLARSGEVERAQVLFQQIVENEPDNVQAWLWLSELTNDIETQTAMLEQAMKHIPEGEDGVKNFQYHLDVLRGLIKPEQLNGGKKLNHAEVFAQAERLVINGKRAEALEHLTKLTQASSEDERVWWLVSELSPRLEEKIEALEKVVEIQPVHPAAHRRLEVFRQARSQPLQAGQHLESLGELEQAWAFYNTLAMESSDAEIQLAAQQHITRLEASHTFQHAEPRPARGLARLLGALLGLTRGRKLPVQRPQDSF